MKTTFTEFTQALIGYTYHSKKTGRQIYKYELYWAKYTPIQVFEKFERRVID